jgi:hypothetical protein
MTGLSLHQVELTGTETGTVVSLNALKSVVASDIDQETKTACENAIRNIEERIGN